MTKAPQTPSRVKPGNLGTTDGLEVHLSFDPSTATAGSTATAVAKVNLGSDLEQGYWVQFNITDGSAIFTDSDPKTDGKQATVQTGGMGRARAAFTDQAAETVSMTATVVKDSDGNPIQNGPSDTEPFTFTGVVHKYGLTFAAPLANNQPADGSTPDEGQAVVTDNNGQLAAPVIVQFTFTKGSAQFVTSGDPNIQSNSTPTTLYVKTHYDSGLGKDIANASFTDQTAEGVTLQASLPDHAEAGSPTQAFSFAAVDHYGLALNKVTDGQPADGSSADAGQAVVTDNGGRLSAPVIVNFTFTSGSAKFALTGDPNIQPGSTATSLLVKTHYDSGLGQDIANASFTDQTAESVTLQASLPDHAEAGSPTQTFSFAAVDHYGLTLNKITDGQQADGSAADEGQAVVTDNGSRLSAPVIVNFTFTSGSAKFVLTGDTNIQPGSTATSLLVKTHYDSSLGKDIANASFTDANAEPVTVKAFLQADPNASGTQDFTFVAVTHDYALTFTTPPLANNQVAGSGADEAQAVVTDNGRQLTDPVIVNFVFTQGSAQFVLTGDANIQPGSTAASLLVKTHYDSSLGKDIANASFTDANAEPVTVKAFLQADPNVNGTQDFTFVAATHDYALTFNPPLSNNQPAYGAPDQGQVVVTDNGGRLSAPVEVTFTFTNGSAQFVLTGDGNIEARSTPTTLYVWTHYDSNLGKDIANASFTDTSAEPVTLKASMTGATPQTQDFTFGAPTYSLGFVTPPPVDNQPANGSADTAQIIAYKDGLGFHDPVIVTFEFTKGSAAFVLTGDSNIQPNSTATTLYVQTHYDPGSWQNTASASFTDSTAEGVTVKASIPGAAPTTQDFTFVSPGRQLIFLYTTYYYLHMKEDGRTVELYNVEDTMEDTNKPPFIFTAQPYGTDGKTFQLINTSNGNTRYLIVGDGGLVSAVPPTTAPASLFQFSYPGGWGNVNDGNVAIQSVANGLYLSSSDLVSVSAAVSDVNDQSCWWMQIFAG